MKPSSNYQPIKEEVAGLTSFLPILWQQKSLIFHIIIASLFITLFGIVSSYYFQGILDFFIPNQARSTLNIISIGLILVYLFRIVFCKTFLHIAKKKYTSLRLKFFSDYFGFDRAFLSR